MLTKTKNRIHKPIEERTKRKIYLNSTEKKAVKEFADKLKILKAKVIRI